MTNAPAISVIIPMYNAKKYIGDCLESILNQTFQDFEVIVVDDCSTDSSEAIVESYAPKFGGRLMLFQLDRNTGSGAVPRNTGFKFSSGKYIFFADADDLLTLTALEELYTLAENFSADVVYCENHYRATCDLNKIIVRCSQMGGALVDKPTFESDDFEERLNRMRQSLFGTTPWQKLVKRNLLIEHEIFFPNVIREDDIWTWNLIFCAKKFLRVPNAVYIWRQTENSVTRKEKTPQETINFWINPVILGLKTLDEIMSRIKFFQQNPQQRYLMLFYFAGASFLIIQAHTSKESPFTAYNAIREKFSDVLGENDVLVSLLCSFVIAQQKRIEELEQTLKEKFS